MKITQMNGTKKTRKKTKRKNEARITKTKIHLKMAPKKKKEAARTTRKKKLKPRQQKIRKQKRRKNVTQKR